MEKPHPTSRSQVWVALIVICVATLFVGVACSFAQGKFGVLTGLVTDQSGSVVSGASVEVKNTQTRIAKTAQSNVDGYYTVEALIPGLYDITVSAPGFKSTTSSGIKIDVAQMARVNIILNVGTVVEHVTVSAEAALLQTENASVSAVLSESGVVNLPLNGRNYLQLATLVPGAGPTSLGGSFFGVMTNTTVMNGMRKSATAYTIDGADVQEQFYDGSSFTPPPDAIQEFRVTTNNMTVENGGGGAIIQAAFKSGTNKLHGDVYEFLRNEALDARNFFAQVRPEFRSNQFGVTLGGPIKKDKAFFFGDYQGTRILQGQTFNSLVPSLAQRGGDFSADSQQLINPLTQQPFTNNQIPQNMFSPQTVSYLQFIPPPNTSGGTFVRNGASTQNHDQFDIRVDYKLTASDSLTATYSLTKSSLVDPGPFPLAGGDTGTNKLQFGSLGWIHDISATAVSQFNASWGRTTGIQEPQGLGTNTTVQDGIGGFELTSLAYPGLPSLNIAGYGSISNLGRIFVPLWQKYEHTNLSEIIYWNKGKHTITIGFTSKWSRGYNANAAFSRGYFDFTGTYTGDAFADYLLGFPFHGYRSFPRNDFGVFQSSQAPFIQDQWKVTPRLTLIAGLRYDLIHPAFFLHNAVASVNPVTNQIIVASNSNGEWDQTAQQVTALVLPLFQSMIVPSSKVGLPASLVYPFRKGFAPRLGLAYDLGHSLIARAGYGIFYAQMQGAQVVSTGLVNPPFLVDELSNFNTVPVPTKNLANMFPPQSPGNIMLTPLSFFQMDPYLRSPMIQQWNVAVQKLVKGVFSLEGAYVGSNTTHLSFSLPLNIPLPGPGPIQSRRANTGFAAGTFFGSTGISNYNALQLKAETRSWHGLYLLSSYTWAKALDNQSDDFQGFQVQDPNNIPAEYGISDFNLASRLTISSTYDLPFFKGARSLVKNLLGNWSVMNIITVQSGIPFTPSLSTDPANTGTSKRPDRTGSGKLADPTIAKWFDASAFQVPQPYTFGNSGRNILTGPPLRNWDFSLFKSFDASRLREGMVVEFRTEFFNFTNTPYFGQPVTSIQSASVGRITSAAAPRDIQLALKVIF
jgi:hypothetical protein